MNKYELSDRKLKIGVLLAVALIGWFCFKGVNTAQSQTNPANLSPELQEVVKLSATHMSEDVILSYIKNSGMAYDLSADDILYLHSQEISQTVINALLNAKPDQTSPAKSDDDPPPPPVTQSSTPAAVAPAIPTTPPPASAVTISDFKCQLSPFGQWVDVPGYGLGWRPNVQDQELGWRPYFNAGHWEYTQAGWFWKSDYSWGQYAFHYGRWLQDARYRWVWTPGYEWAPAWVCWRNCANEGYCGWAPLPPGARFQAGVGLTWNGHPAVDVDFGLGANAFVFIPSDHFWAHDYRAFLAPAWRWSALYRHSYLANGYRMVGGHFVVEGPGRERFGLLTHRHAAPGRVDFHDGQTTHVNASQRGY
jgi:hypothetical protein